MLCLRVILVSPGADHWILVSLVQWISIGPREIPEAAQSLAVAIPYQMLCPLSCLEPRLTQSIP